MKGQLAGHLIELPAREPMCHTTPGECVKGSSHPPPYGAELCILLLSKHTALKLWQKKVANNLTLSSQREKDHNEHDEKGGDHYDDVRQKEYRSAK